MISVHKLRNILSVIPRLDRGIQCFCFQKHSGLDCPVKPDNDKYGLYEKILTHNPLGGIPTFLLLFSLLFILTVTGLPVSAHAQDDAGLVVALKGQAVIQREGRTLNAALKEKIFLKDTVETRAASRAKMLFRDDSILTLAENSRVVIQEYLAAEGGKKGRTIFRLMDGKVRSLVGDNEFEVHTPTVVVAARGTYFITWSGVENGTPMSGVAVIEGVIELRSSNTAIAGVVKVERGMMSKGYQNQPPTPAMPTPVPLMKDLIEATELQSAPEPEKKPVIEERKGPAAQIEGKPALKDEIPAVKSEALPQTPPIVNQEPPRLQDTPVRIHIPIPPAETPVDIKIPIPDGT